MTEIEDDRCSKDLLYAAFHRPETVIDDLLAGMMQFIERKYSPMLGNTYRYDIAKQFLTQHPRADPRCKLFFMLLIVTSEQEARDFLVPHCRGDKEHMERFAVQCTQAINETLRHNFGETNVVARVHQLVACAEYLYLTTKSPIFV